jgi:glutamate--cysteine ligase catalytic subunit
MKSTGELMTNAKFLRQFVLTHPAYQKDSVVSEEINFDLFREIDKICSGQISLTEALKAK